MKLTEAKCRIIGVQLGEAQINIIRPDAVPIRAKMALIADDGVGVCGYYEKANGWSEKTMKALQALAEAIEEDALSHVFMSPEAISETEKADEPAQF